MKKYYFVSLGCPKNQVDSERAIHILNTNGYELVCDPALADILIINTCSFIEDAKKESVEKVLELIDYKSKDKKILIVTGCLPQRYKDELLESLNEVDIWLGTNEYNKLPDILSNYKGKRQSYWSDNYSNEDDDMSRHLLSPKFWAYLKIAEGCSHKCSYCIIPEIRGTYRSTPFEKLVKEAEFLVEKGVKELILIAQDTTSYGKDIYKRYALPELIEKLCKINSLKWLRLLYIYPSLITDELFEIIAREEKICKYIDIPFQHASPKILKKMGRPGNAEKYLEIIKKARKIIPNVVLRTSLIVGYPGEDEEDFEILKDFVIKARFERLGVFKYSDEENTKAYLDKPKVSQRVKIKRYNEIMELQQGITYEINSFFVEKMKANNRSIDVLIEGVVEKDNFFKNFNKKRGLQNKLQYSNISFGRSSADAPDIDGLVYVMADKPVITGSLVKVSLDEAMVYDLVGVLDAQQD